MIALPLPDVAIANTFDADAVNQAVRARKAARSNTPSSLRRTLAAGWSAISSGSRDVRCSISADVAKFTSSAFLNDAHAFAREIRARRPTTPMRNARSPSRPTWSSVRLYRCADAAAAASRHAGFQAAAVQNAETLLACSKRLWTMPAREYQYVATNLLARNWKTLAVTDIAHLQTIAQHASWWDTIDPLAAVVDDVLKAARVQTPQSHAQATMDAALLHESMWVRRIAMIHQLGWRAHTDEDRLFGYARSLAAESDFFIRKAIGWALRDYARHAPEAVSDFLSASRDLISPLTLREASKHLPPIL